ncbi:GNAT family N-acetyltransferase [Haladaptatus cibarius]|uniref:GNAT family N-acetyltransferase n=1 Tax=Haladaptatus cibarius TaxID=453847 RepID=UPI0006796C05|nr:GNAT family protein [Haladaptatus cibarius]
MVGSTFISGETVTLRTVEEDDIGFLQQSRNEPGFRRTLRFTKPTNRKQMRSFFENTVVGDDASVNLLVSVEGTPVGAVNVFNIDQRCGEISYWILPEHRQNGTATEAISLLLDFAYDTLDLHRVYAQTIASNEASKAFLEALGFTLEGTLREHEFVQGERQDTHFYGLLAPEWRNQ